MFYCIDNNNICLPLHKLKTNNIQHTHLHKFFNLVIVLTLDFWYMIKTKEATESAAVEFCSHFEQIADPPNFLRKLALKVTEPSSL